MPRASDLSKNTLYQHLSAHYAGILTSFVCMWLQVSTYPVLVGGTMGLLARGCLAGVGMVGVATDTERVWSDCPADCDILSTTLYATPFSKSSMRLAGSVDACCHVNSEMDFPTQAT